MLYEFEGLIRVQNIFVHVEVLHEESLPRWETCKHIFMYQNAVFEL